MIELVLDGMEGPSCVMIIALYYEKTTEVEVKK